MKTPGQIACEAYMEALRGGPSDQWHLNADHLKSAWETAAAAVAEAERDRIMEGFATRMIEINAIPWATFTVDEAVAKMREVFAPPSEPKQPVVASIELTFIVAGNPFNISAKLTETLAELRVRVLKESGTETWRPGEMELRDADGTRLHHMDKTVEATGIKPGAELWLTPRVGVGG